MDLNKVTQEQLERLKHEQIINALRKKTKKIKTIKVKAPSRDLIADAIVALSASASVRNE